jgi:CheY-like chemotaxis protein
MPSHVAATRILVVDDEKDVREFVALILSSAGYQVDTASDGAEALAKIEAAAPNLLVLDLMMPVMNGWKLLERLREKGSPLPLVVILSAAGDLAEALKAGAYACVSKPFDVGYLLKTCTRAILAAEGHGESAPSAIVDWVPPERTPTDVGPWRRVIDAVVSHGSVRLVWNDDAWTVVSALRFKESATAADVRAELREALRGAGLSVS